MLWKERALKWSIQAAIIATGIVFVLVTLMLLPSITEGPDALHILKRAQCKITKVEYLENLCLRDTSQEFSNLKYIDNWNDCKIVKYHINTDLILNNETINCTWKYPESFNSENDAFIGTSARYYKDLEYSCVADTLSGICYPNKHELLIFLCSTIGLLLVFIGTIVAHFKLKRWIKKNKEDFDKISREV